MNLLTRQRLPLWAGALLASWVAVATAEPAGFVLTDGVEGPTCAYYTALGNLAWTRPGGDWIDASGRLHGSEAYDSERLGGGSGRSSVTWDVTRLAHEWSEHPNANAGLLLRGGEADKGTLDFHSRESADEAARPTLELQFAGGRRIALAPAADSYLDCTSLRSLGHHKLLKVSRQQAAWLRFDLPTDAGVPEKATLHLHSDKRYGSGATVSVFKAAPPYVRDEEPARQGLSAGFQADRDIARHPAVVFATGFEAAGWSSQWSEFSSGKGTEPVRQDAALKFEPLSGRALRVRVEKGRNLGLNLRYLFQRQGVPEPEDIYFRYYLRLSDDWNPTSDGGKLPGIAGTYGAAGWGLRKSDGYNGWSVRGAYARAARDDSLSSLNTIGSYAYHADMHDRSGDYWGWNEGPSGMLERNRWYSVEQRVKLNTPGAHDGLFEAWIDGRRVTRREGIAFRHTPKLKIEEVWLNVYHGGTQVAPHDLTLYIDNVVIARDYIGPLRN